MVAVFFVMSGYVLSAAYENSRDSSYALVVSRFVRLYIPAIIAFILAIYINYLFSPISNATSQDYAGKVLERWSNHKELVFNWSDFIGMFFGFGGSGLFQYKSQVSLDDATLVPLWTISYEMIGSVLILLISKIRIRSQSLWLYTVLACLIFFGVREIGLFVFGHLLHVSRVSERSKFFRIFLAILVVIVFWYLNKLGWGYKETQINSFFSGLAPHASPLNVLKGLAGFVIVTSVLVTPALQRFLSAKFFQFLGRLSFSIYLLHLPIVVGLGSFICMQGGRRLAFIIAGVLIALVPYAVVFSRLCDRSAIMFAKNICARKSRFFPSSH
jgi:peptidoglycan/LPS O-acetylase OafA/YrhL